jgi:hypothetical protein
MTSPAGTPPLIEVLDPPPVPGPFFPVSIRKFCVLSLLSWGIYDIYWAYYQWKRIKEREGEDLSPFWRAFFAPIWMFYLLPRIAATGGKYHAPVGWNGSTLALGYLVLQFAVRLPDPWWLVTLFSFVPLVPAAIAVERINKAAGATEDPNARFTGGNWVGMIFGGLFLALVLLGMSLPPV